MTASIAPNLRRGANGGRTARAALWLLVTAVLILESPTASTAPAPDTVAAIRNVTVIVGDGTPPRRQRTVIIRNGRIDTLHPPGRELLPRHTTVIDGTGRFLLPGFVDTHVHVAMGPVSVQLSEGAPTMSLSPLERLPAITARRLLAHGISLARDPGGASGLTVRTRERIASGHLPGPTLQVAGEILDTSTFENLVAPVAGVDDVRAEVARQAAAGVDWIKLYVGLAPALVEAAVDAAHGHGLRVTGHLEKTTWTGAAALGIDSLVHIMPGSPELLPAEARSRYAKSRASTLSMLEWFALVDHDSPVIQEMVAALRRHHVSLDPTLVVLHSMAHGDRNAYTDNPALAGLPPELVGNWQTFFNFNPGWQAADFERARDLYPRAAAFARMLFEAGVTLTAGSDANNPWLVPGDSYHTELELLVKAGIPPLDVITIATRNGAEALGLLARTGTVEAGKRADLVLLAENPLTDIRATRKIVWVMKGGEIHVPEALEAR